MKEKMDNANEVKYGMDEKNRIAVPSFFFFGLHAITDAFG